MTTSTRTLRAVIYCRASLDMTGEGLSNDRQEKSCRLKVDSHEWELVDVARETVSGYGKKKRPEWERVLQMVRDGKVDVIVAWHLDRITRSMKALEELIDVVEEYGVSVKTVEGDFNLDSDLGKLVARILSAVARAEVERKGRRQQHANAANADAGLPYLPGPRPLGYEPDQMTLREAEADAIVQAVQDVLNGVSLREVARRWTALGIGHKRKGASGEWAGGSVRRTLLNPRYVGRRVYKGVDVGPGKWPAILDEATHRRLKNELTASERYDGPANPQGRKPQTLLVSIAKCGVCGEPMKTLASIHGKRYTCPSHHATPRRDVLDQAVSERMVAFLMQPEIKSMLLAGDDQSEAAHAELEKVSGKLDRLAEMYEADELDDAEYFAAVKRLRPRREAAEKALSNMATGTALEGLSVGTPAVVEQWSKLSLHRQRAIVDRFLDVVVHPVQREPGVPFRFDPTRHATILPKGLTA